MQATNHQENGGLGEDLRREIKQAVKHEARVRGRRHCLGCLTVYVIVFGIPLLLAVVTLARTGLYRIPVFSSLFYRPVAAVRPVPPLAGFDSELIWKQAIASMSFHAPSSTATITFSEEELTTMVRDSLDEAAGSLPFDIEQPQMAVQPDGLELFFYVPRGERLVPVAVQLKAGVTRGAFTLDLQRIVVGSATVPKFAAAVLGQLVDTAIAQQFDAALPAGLVFREIETTEDGRLRLKVSVP
jgi:hypothetical protein